jgi:hypothetical protein
VQTIKINDTQLRQETTMRLGNREFVSALVFDAEEPSWVVQYPVNDPADMPHFLDALLNSDIGCDYSAAIDGWKNVGEDYLLEMWLGVPFFDFVACSTMGFEKTLEYFLSEETTVLQRFQQRYIEFQIEQIRRACAATPFESFCLGCAYSCNSLIGPNLWRQWDKPVIRAVAEELHRHGRLLHIHFHGRCLETVGDFAEIGIDCVCPFERPPGGDIKSLEGLKQVRNLLDGKVAMNGNVHTVKTLIRGTPEAVRDEVRQIKQAFAGEPRLIIGTGDQVGRETPEENLWAMIESAGQSHETISDYASPLKPRTLSR